MSLPLEEQLKRHAKDLNKLLSCCRQAIADCTESSGIAQDQARQVVSTVHQFLCDYEQENPTHSPKIQQWWKDIFQSLLPDGGFRELPVGGSSELPDGGFQEQIDSMTDMQKRKGRYERRLQQAWGLSSREVLQSRFCPAAGFSKPTLQALVQFAERVACEPGQAALEEALKLRLQHNKDRPCRTKVAYLVPADVATAEELYDSNQAEGIDNPNVSTRRKRKLTALEDRLFSANAHTAGGKRQCVNPVRTRENTPAIEDSTPDAPALTDVRSVKVGLDSIDEANESVETTEHDEKLEQHTPYAHAEEEHSKVTQPTAKEQLQQHRHHHQDPANREDSSTIEDQAAHECTIDKTRLPQSKPSNEHSNEPSDEVELLDGQSIHEPSQDLTRSDIAAEETEGQGDTSASIEIGRGVRASPNARDESSIMIGGFSSPSDAEGDSGIRSPSGPLTHLGLTPPSPTFHPARRSPSACLFTPEGQLWSSALSRKSPSVLNTRQDGGPTSPNQTNGEASSLLRHDVPELDLSTDAADSPPPSTLPTTDLAGALSTLEPGRHLSASAIERVLSICCPESARVIDSACFHLHPDFAIPPRIRPCGDDIATVLVPIHHKNHWTLAILERQTRLITHYNSLPTASRLRTALGKSLPMFMSGLEEGDAASFSMAYKDLGTQYNSYDCGVHVLYTALCAFVNATPSTSPDTGLWRLILRAMLTEQLQIEPSKPEPQLQGLVESSKHSDVETSESADLESHEARVTDSRLRVASAESAMDLLNQLSNHMVTSSLSWSQLPDISERFLSSLSELALYGSVAKHLPSLDQSRKILRAGLTQGDRIRKHAIQAERCLRAAIGTAQKAKQVRIEDKRRLALQMEGIADAWRNKGYQRLEAAAAQIEASEKLRLLMCEE